MLRLQALGEKLAWFKDALAVMEGPDEGSGADCDFVREVAEAYMSGFEEELEQINLKNSVGANKGKNR